MPIIRRVDAPGTAAQVVQTTKRQALPSSAFGNQALGGLLEGTSAFLKAKEEVDQQRFESDAENAVLEYERQKRNLFFNPESGYFNTSGKTAYDQAEGARKALADIRRTTGEKLGPESAEMYNKVTDKDLVYADTDIMKHSAAGNRTYVIATKNAVMEDSIESASFTAMDDGLFGNPDQNGKKRVTGFGRAYDAGAEALKERLRLEGVPEGSEIWEQQLNNFDDQMYGAKIVGALRLESREGLEQAKKDLDSVIFKMDPEMVSKITVAIEAQDKKLFMREAAEEIRVAGGSLSDRRRAARELAANSGMDDVASDLLASVENEYNAEKREQLDRDVTLTEHYASLIEAKDSTFTWDQIQTEKWNGFSSAVKKTLKGLTAIKAAGKKVNTDWAVHHELFSKSDKDLKAIENPLLYRDKLADVEYKQFYALWRSVNGIPEDDAAGSGGGGSFDFTNIRTNNQIVQDVTGMLLSSNYDADKSDHRKLFNNLHVTASYIMRDHEMRTGKSMTNIELRNALLENLGTTTGKNKLFGFSYEGDVSLDDFETADVNRFSEVLSGMGIQLSTGNFKELQDLSLKHELDNSGLRNAFVLNSMNIPVTTENIDNMQSISEFLEDRGVPISYDVLMKAYKQATKTVAE